MRGVERPASRQMLAPFLTQSDAESAANALGDFQTSVQRTPHPPMYTVGLRDFLLRMAAGFGLAAVLITETLSAFHLLRPVPLALAWIVCALAVVIRFRQYLPRPHLHLEKLAIAAAVSVIAGIVALTAI